MVGTFLTCLEWPEYPPTIFPLKASCVCKGLLKNRVFWCFCEKVNDASSIQLKEPWLFSSQPSQCYFPPKCYRKIPEVFVYSKYKDA